MTTKNGTELPFSRNRYQVEPGEQGGGNYRDRLRIYHAIVNYWIPLVDPADYDKVHRIAAEICDI